MSASLVVDFVSRARRRRQWRSALESLALGGAAALLALAACRFSLPAHSGSSPSAWAWAACAALSGLAMAGTWWVERAKKSDLELAAQLDVRLARDGALATAYEARVRGMESPLVDLAEERLALALDRPSLRRALPPAGFIWLAPPALAAALFAFALELPLQRELRGGSFAGTTPDAGLARVSMAARSILQRAQLARSEPASFASDPLRRAQLVALIDGALSSLDLVAAGESDSPSLAADAGLRAELRAERDALTEAEKSSARTSNGAPGVPAGDRAAANHGGGAGTATEGDNSLLTNGAPDRTMSGSNRPTADLNDARSPTHVPDPGSGGEAGTLAGRWWDERYDPVVQGWRRALAARKEQR
ncbi:MAG TPA: hypothetical protein VM509_01645 [Planctomycetota bacterium]|nr:hypothetical protein [Planctomycetota bacterium]